MSSHVAVKRVKKVNEKDECFDNDLSPYYQVEIIGDTMRQILFANLSNFESFIFLLIHNIRPNLFDKQNLLSFQGFLSPNYVITEWCDGTNINPKYIDSKFVFFLIIKRGKSQLFVI